MLALDLNSGGHVLLEGGECVCVPALAVLEPPALLLGAAAARRARLAPLFVSRAHWESPDNKPLPRALPAAATAGQVAFAQLGELWPVASRAGAVAVSPATSPEDLAHLAGLFQAAAREPLVWVDAAVAGTAQRAASARALWVEAEAGRTVLAELQREDLGAGWQVRRSRVELSRAVGTTKMDDVLARAVAQHFLVKARFDPLAVAATEQALYDALPGVYAALAAGQDVAVALGAGAGTGAEMAAREVTLDPVELVLACRPLVADVLRLVQSARRAGEPLTLHVGARLAMLPGLLAALQALPGLAVDPLPLEAAAAGVRALVAGLVPAREAAPPAAVAPGTRTGEAARWLTAAPAMAPLVLPAATIPDSALPTHVLWQGSAWPLSAVPLVAGRAPGAAGLMLEGPAAGLSREHCQLVRVGNEAVVEDLSTYGTWLNGERVRRRARLRAGDVLRLGVPGVELVLLAVQPAAPGG